MKFKLQFLLIFLLIMNVSISNVQAIDKRKLENIIQNDASLEGALISLSVRSAKTGEVLYEHLSDTRLRPASNMKLFTAAAALSVLGEEHRFTTDLYTDGNIKWKVLNGNLFIKGSGDPTLLKENIDNLVKQLVEKEIKFIKGDLIGDDSRFDEKRYSIDLPWSDEEEYYGAQVSALTVSPDNEYEAGTVNIQVLPGKEIGEKGQLIVKPELAHLTIINSSTTVTEDHDIDLSVSRDHGTNNIYVKGTIPKLAPEYTHSIALWEPTDYVMELLKQSLEEHGISFWGKIKRSSTPSSAKQLASHDSMPLRELLIPFMKLSNNVHADTLIKEMGYMKEGNGDWDTGIEVLKEALKKWGIETESMIIRDGSGISHVNAIATHDISKLLYEIQTESWFESFLHSLPLVDGEDILDRGTLQERLSQTVASGKVRAKTGTLTSVSSLAGFIDHNDESLIFSIILNQMLDGDQAKRLEDQLVLAIFE